MTEQNRFAPGWYKDPAGAPLERWYNGAMWTEDTRPLPTAPQNGQPPAGQPQYGQYAAPGQTPQQYGAPQYGAPQNYGAPQQYPPHYGRPFQPEIPATVEVNTIWVWIVSLIILVSMVSLLFFDFPGFMRRSMDDYSFAGLGMYTDPGYLFILFFGWIIYGFTVFAAYRDYRHLQSVGIHRPFHWAWTFLYTLVYVIGRASTLNKAAQGRGKGPMWAAISAQIVYFVFVVIWMIVAINSSMSYIFNDLYSGRV